MHEDHDGPGSPADETNRLEALETSAIPKFVLLRTSGGKDDVQNL